MANTKIPVELSSTPGIVDNSNATAITIDSSENVGIGTNSPSSYFSGATNLVLSGTGDSGLTINSGTSSTSRIHFADGTSGDNRHRGYVVYVHTDDSMQFATTGIERMRIDSSGNLIVGGTSAFTASATTITPNGDFRGVLSSGSGGDTFISAISGVSNGYQISVDSSNNQTYKWHNGGTQSMTLDSSGRVGIAQDTPGDFNAAADDLVIGNSGGDFGITIRTGTASNGSIHFADGTAGDAPNRGIITYDHSDDHMQFNVAGVERMRILESNGSILMGKSANSIDARGHWFRNNGESFHTVLSTDNTLHVYDTTNNLYRFYVTGGGTINATSTSITAISDERLKENIVDLETGLSEVMSLQPRRFDWKNGDGENVAGFIAQEVETVLPDLIGDYKHEELEDAKAIKMGDMIPTLVKAIQEQQAQIEALQSEINELKNS